MTKTRSSKGDAPRRGRMLPDDACPACGTPMIEKRKTLRLPVNGDEITVPSSTHLSCPKCARSCFACRTPSGSARMRSLAIGRSTNLLSADEIRAIREHFSLTQAELARLLRLGANTVSRWEPGRNVQTRAMDMLLRLIRDLPDSIEYLRDHAA
jgi:putative zinc finger/helix-turn-helix YgiT family protein